MKKLYSFLLLSGIALSSAAQTMRVHCGPVCTLIPAATAGDIVPSADATALTVMGNTFHVADIDSIVVDKKTVYTPGLVDVAYEGAKASITVAGDVAPLLAVTVTAARCIMPTTCSEVRRRSAAAGNIWRITAMMPWDGCPLRLEAACAMITGTMLKAD